MYRELASLLLYSDLGDDEILVRLAEILNDWASGSCDKTTLVRRIHGQVKRLLDLATVCGFDHLPDAPLRE